MIKNIFIPGLFISLISFAPCFCFSLETDDNTIQLLTIQAKKGSISAPYQLGYCYEHGEDVGKNLAEAAKWYLLGAARGDMQSAISIANMYLNGNGVQKDENEAIFWYTRAAKGEGLTAELGRATLILLARNYSLGYQGTKPDPKKADAIFANLFDIEAVWTKRFYQQFQDTMQKSEEDFKKLQNADK